jgi:hypothetical protein
MSVCVCALRIATLIKFKLAAPDALPCEGPGTHTRLTDARVVPPGLLAQRLISAQDAEVSSGDAPARLGRLAGGASRASRHTRTRYATLRLPGSTRHYGYRSGLRRRAGRHAGDPLQTYAVDWAKVESAPTARSIEPQSAVTCGCDLTHQGCVGRTNPTDSCAPLTVGACLALPCHRAWPVCI